MQWKDGESVGLNKWFFCYLENPVSVLKGPIKDLNKLSKISFEFVCLGKIVYDMRRNKELGGVIFELSVPRGNDSFAFLNDLF
jgi:hypothetical protein